MTASSSAALPRLTLEELADKAGVPVWNGLTTMWHPTQMLADALTVQENFNYDIKGRTLVFMGDCKNNVARSLMVVCAKLGMNFVACGPKHCMPGDEWSRLASRSLPRMVAPSSSPTIPRKPAPTLTLSTPTFGSPWASPTRFGLKRIKELEPYRVTAELMALAKPEAIFLHCLPAFHDTNTTIGAQKAEQFGVTEMEVTDAVFESKQSKVFDEAENRMHTIKAVMYATLK